MRLKSEHSKERSLVENINYEACIVVENTYTEEYLPYRTKKYCSQSWVDLSQLALIDTAHELYKTVIIRLTAKKEIHFLQNNY